MMAPTPVTSQFLNLVALCMFPAFKLVHVTGCSKSQATGSSRQGWTHRILVPDRRKIVIKHILICEIAPPRTQTAIVWVVLFSLLLQSKISVRSELNLVNVSK